MIDGFDNAIFVMTETMKCISCGKEGYLVRACPEKRDQDSDMREIQGSNTTKENEVIENAVQNVCGIKMSTVELTEKINMNAQENKEEVRE